MWSALTVGSNQSVDQSAPSAPAFTGIVQDGKNWNVGVALPTQDADGGPLTGLKRLTVASAPMADGLNPFDGLSPDEAFGLAVATVQTVSLTDADAGQVKDVVVPVLNMGGQQAFAIAVNDEA